MIRSAISRALLAVGCEPTESKSGPSGMNRYASRAKENRSLILNSQKVTHRAGECFTISLTEMPAGDSPERPGASMVRLYENLLELGPAHCSHADIERLGHGRFSHWSDSLYFSSSDG